MVKESGWIFNIQRFCVHDGPGIRTTVFLKGCPLNCVWCHNPEGITPGPSILYNSELCMGCGSCTSCLQGSHIFADELHVYGRAKCIRCGECAIRCTSKALQKIGQCLTVAEVMIEVLKDRAYYMRSGGGLTLSGGEPLYQPDFSASLLANAIYEGIHTTVETSGMGSQEALALLIPNTKLFLFDFKIANDTKSRHYTGAGTEQIHKNLEFLATVGMPLILRCPIIPSINDDVDHMRDIAHAVKKKQAIQEIHLLPYHTLGESKREQIEDTTAYSFVPPTRTHMETLLRELQKMTDVPVRIT